MRIALTAAVIVLLAGASWAQQPAAPAGAAGRATQPPAPATDLTKGTVMSDAEVRAAIAKMTVAPDRGITTFPLFRLVGDRPYTVTVEHRVNRPQGPAVHEADAEFLYVLDGSATFNTGGKLVGERRVDATNLSGTSTEGGIPTKLTKGDFFMVPEGVAHWFSQVDPTTGISLMSMRLPRK